MYINLEKIHKFSLQDKYDVDLAQESLPRPGVHEIYDFDLVLTKYLTLRLHYFMLSFCDQCFRLEKIFKGV